MADATNRVYYCPVELVLDLLGSKWKPSVLRHMCDGIDTYGEIQQKLPLVTRRTLDTLLSELERDGLVEKTVHSDHRDREGYALTDTGACLGPILEGMANLGAEYAALRGIEVLDNEAAELEPAAAEATPHWEAWSWLPL